MTNETNMRTHEHWRISAFYVFAFAAGGVIQPFLNLYLVEEGFTALQIGVIHGWGALAAVIIAPMIGFLADRTQRHRLFLGIDTIVKGLSAPLMLLSSAWTWMVVTVSMRTVAAGVSEGLLNPLTMKYLKARGSQNIGAVRIWGASSFAVTSILAGWMASDQSVSVLFPLAGVFGIIAAMFVGAFPKRIDESRIQTVRESFRFKPSANILLLYFLSFLYAFSYSGPDTFTNVYLVQFLGAGNQFIGLIGAVLRLAPLAGFYFSDQLIERIGGAGTMSFSFSLLTISWIGYALIGAPVLAIPFAILQGLGNAMYLVSMIILITAIGKSSRASMDMLLILMTIPGLANIIAQPVSGLIYDGFGARSMFILDAVVLLVALILLRVFRRKLSTTTIHE